MGSTLIEDATNVFKKNQCAVIKKHKVAYPVLGKFCTSLHQFDTQLGEVSKERYWQKYLIPLKRIRFDLCAAPLPKEYQNAFINRTILKLKKHLQLCGTFYPNHSDNANLILEILSTLCNNQEDFLLDKLLDITNEEEQSAWVIKESRLIEEVEKIFKNLKINKILLLHPLELKSVKVYDQLIVVGPPRWFPESIFTAARSKLIEIVNYDWINDNWKPTEVFINPIKRINTINESIEYSEDKRFIDLDEISASNLLTISGPLKAMHSIVDSSNKDNDEYNSVDAKCIILEGTLSVFIEYSEGSKMLVLDTDAEDEGRLFHKLVKELSIGNFILVRTSGGGDYIIPVADRILGKQAEELRNCQIEWKTELLIYVRKNGLLKTAIDLLELGSQIANEGNVRNWISPRNIKTQSYKDFFAIMVLVGLEDHAEDYWKKMKVINKAHHKAGFEIRKLLLSQVKHLDISELQRKGKMDFKLSEQDEGGLTAYRIEHIIDEIFTVPYSKIGEPFELEEQLWQQ